MESVEIDFYELLKKYNFSEEDAKKFVQLQKELHQETLATKADLANLKSALTWRMFLFWLTQIGVFLGFAYKLFPNT